MDERTSEISNIIATVNPALATKLIDSMTQNELRELLGLNQLKHLLHYDLLCNRKLFKNANTNNCEY